MKVILLKDDKRYGKKGDIINVNDGFANNYLIPNKIVTSATSSSLNEARQLKESEQHKEQELLNAAKELSEKLKEVTVTLSVKTGENGKIFGSITNKEIAQELEGLGIAIDKKKIELNNPIKTIGLFTIKVKLHPKVQSEVNVNVISQ